MDVGGGQELGLQEDERMYDTMFTCHHPPASLHTIFLDYYKLQNSISTLTVYFQSSCLPLIEENVKSIRTVCVATAGQK